MHESVPVWLVSGFVSGLVSYFTTLMTLSSRLAALEERVHGHAVQISDIKGDVQYIRARIDAALKQHP